MFQLTADDKEFLHQTIEQRQNLMRSKGGLELKKQNNDQPFYVTSKNNWKAAINEALEARGHGQIGQKSVDNCSFLFCFVDFQLTLLFESLDEEAESLFSPAISNGLQQTVIVYTHSILESIGQLVFEGLQADERKRFKRWQLGLCNFLDVPIPQDIKESDFERMNKSRNRVHQDKIENRNPDYFEVLKPDDLCLPVRALQKTTASILKGLPRNGLKPPRRFKKSLLVCADLEPCLRIYAQARFDAHERYRAEQQDF